MIGIIGGSGAYAIPGLVAGQRFTLETDYGRPSAEMLLGTWHDAEVAFLPRHGSEHQIPPHRINYRANIAALRQQGVNKIIALNAVGSIRADCAPPDLAVPHQILDYTWGRQHTFFDGEGGGVDHVDFTSPYDEQCRSALIDSAARLGLRHLSDGIYAAMQGPRLESAAEIDRLERDGADLVGMTGMPEAALARETGIAYAALCIVVNPAAGRGEGEITMEMIRSYLKQGVGDAFRVVGASLADLQD